MHAVREISDEATLFRGTPESTNINSMVGAHPRHEVNSKVSHHPTILGIRQLDTNLNKNSCLRFRQEAVLGVAPTETLPPMKSGKRALGLISTHREDGYESWNEGTHFQATQKHRI